MGPRGVAPRAVPPWVGAPKGTWLRRVPGSGGCDCVPPPPAPCRITAISGLSRRCSKAKWTRRANQWCRRPGVPLCQLRRNELGLGASRAPEGAGRARSCPLSLQKCSGKPRSPPMSFGLGDVGCDRGQSRHFWLTSKFLLLPSGLILGSLVLGSCPSTPLGAGGSLPPGLPSLPRSCVQHPTKGSTEPGTSSAGHWDGASRAFYPITSHPGTSPAGKDGLHHRAPNPSSAS